jgi:ferredoxin
MGKQEQHRITGIVRNLPASVVEDFSCAEVVNMRNKDGVWRPVGKKKAEVENSPLPARLAKIIGSKCIACAQCTEGHICPVFAITVDSISTGSPWRINSEYCVGCGACVDWGQCPGNAFEWDDTSNVKFFLHTTGTTQQMIGYGGGFIRYFDYPNRTVVNRILTLPVADRNRKVRFNAVGSILVIFVEADGERAPYVKYAVWMKQDGDVTEKYYVLPELQEIKLDCVGDCTMIEKGVDESYNGEYAPEFTIPEDMNGLFFIRAAYETVTGEYIYPSRVLYYDSSPRLKNTYADGNNAYLTGKMYFLHELYVSVGALTINDLIPIEWKDLIVNISVFISEPKVLGPYESRLTYLRTRGLNMYKILEVDKYGVYGTRVTRNYIAIKFSGKDVLLTNRRLDIIDSCSYYGNADFVYNSRLFLGDISTLFPSPYNYGYKQNIADNYKYEYFFKITLKTDYGLLEVLSEKTPVSNVFLNINHNIVRGIPTGTTVSEQTGNFIVLDSVVYQDYRAINCSIYVREKSNAPINGCMAWLVERRDLTPVPDLNMSISFYTETRRPDELGDGKTLFHLDSYDGSKMFDIKSFGGFIDVDKEISGKTQEEVKVSNKIISNPNEIKASSLVLPIVYLHEQSYTVEKRVVGFSANNLSIDASNFGMFPVFAFTEGGIYAMELGADGGTLVQRIVPMSGDVCISRDSITNIGGATLFASKDGLRVLQGQRSEKITTPLEIYEGNPLRDATLKSGKKILDAIMEKYGLQGYVSSETDFQTFLSGAKCYFHYKENEVVITNEAYPYSYVYSLNTKMYHKVYERYYNVFNDYPNAYGTDVSGQRIYNLGEEIAAPGGRRNVLVQTNAFKLTTDGFEMIRRIFTRFGWNAAPEGSKIGIYLFVSNDTRRWAWVDGCEITQGKAPHGAQNFAPLRCPASVKYGMLVIAGDMDMVNDYLTHISVEYEQRYGNKLR